MAEPDKVVCILLDLLGDLHYDSSDARDRVRKHGYCMDCYFKLFRCQCDTDMDEDHEEDEKGGEEDAKEEDGDKDEDEEDTEEPAADEEDLAVCEEACLD